MPEGCGPLPLALWLQGGGSRQAGRRARETPAEKRRREREADAAGRQWRRDARGGWVGAWQGLGRRGGGGGLAVPCMAGRVGGGLAGCRGGWQGCHSRCCPAACSAHGRVLTVPCTLEHAAGEDGDASEELGSDDAGDAVKRNAGYSSDYERDSLVASDNDPIELVGGGEWMLCAWVGC